MNRYVLALGSSHHNALEYIEKSLISLRKNKNISITSISRVYENYAIGFMKPLRVLNAAVCLTNKMPALAFFRELVVIERNLGKISPYKNAPRTIDIDLIMSLDFSYTTSNFSMPHKELLNRDFFITPMNEALYLANWPIFSKINKSALKKSLRLKPVGFINF